MTASPSAELELMRASLLLESDPAAAARCATAVLASSPGNTEASLLLASACRRLGDTERALALLKPVAETQPDSSLLQLEFGRVCLVAGRTAEAIAALRRAVALDPRLDDGWRELARALFASGETAAGDVAYLQYERLAHDPPQLGEARAALTENRLEAAETLVRRRLRDEPGDVAALRMLADLALQRDDGLECERCLNECLAIAPGSAGARFDLARLLYAQERNAEVLPLIERLLAANPTNIDYLSLKVRVLRFVGRNAEAVSLMDAAVTQHPQEERAWLLYGHLLREVGEQARAIEMYRKALAVQPGSGHAYWSLANLKTVRFSTADVEAMQRELGSSRGAEHISLEFALGKALEDAERYAESFAHYSRGNALQRATLAYDADLVSARVERCKRTWSQQFFSARRGWGSPRIDPIFVVGLPRCGSTLIEQMLASHSQVQGTRELQDVPALVRELVSQSDPQSDPAYPELTTSLGAEQVASLAVRYLSRTQAERTSGRPRFVDKRLDNFGHVGLVHLMFPHATIIDVRRHPLGCGFACFRQLFVRGQLFSYDLAEMGRYYRNYVSLMEHFDAVLPGRVYRLYYEHLIADPEGELRRLLEHCGLAFEAQCLRFHETRRIVNTISSEQVRRPIYSESVAQWRHYEPWLGPLKEALGELAERYPMPPPTSAL